MQLCPKCKSDDIHRSHARTRVEEWRKQITGKRLYRCRACGWRGWGVELGPRFGEGDTQLATRAMAPEPPTLTETIFSHDDQRKELRLDQLDALEAFVHKQK